ncbi:MAG: aspartate kinase [Acetobacteraceae bacterium]|nr:aspartate kinase [Acetobacteraceae bacterium]
MRVIVQKFGGTSLATAADRQRAAGHVARARGEGFSPVVVVSAMGRSGDPYATDTLLALVRETWNGAQPREVDLLVSCGELISASLMAITLQAVGIDAVALSGAQAGIVTDGQFGEAAIVRVEPGRVLDCLGRAQVAVVAGFQGATETGEATTLGRGGSDTTAAALGAALGAEVVEIYTDVDGVKTADPRLVPEARTLEVVGYEEIAQMAVEGARVVHPRAVEIAMRNNVPLRVRSTFTQDPGTLVTHRFQAAPATPDLRLNRIITGVTFIPGLARLCLRVEGEDAALADLDLRVFKGLARAGISVDLINVSPATKSFCIKEEQVEQALQVLARQGLAAEVTPGCAKVSVVGQGMRGVPGVMASVVEALHGAGVKILQTSDSHVTISCLVRADQLHPAVRALHRQFRLDRLPGGPGEVQG